MITKSSPDNKICGLLRNTFFTGICLIGFVLLLAGPTFANDEETLKKLRTQIQQQEKELQSLESSRAGLIRQIEAVQKNQSDIRQAIALTARQLEQNRIKITSLQAEEKMLAAKSAQYQGQAQTALRFIMDNSGTLTARVILGGGRRNKISGESMQTAAVMEIVARLNVNLMDAVRQYADAMQQITTIKAGIVSENIKLEENRKSSDALNISLKTMADTLNVKLTLVRQDQKAQQEYIDMLKSEQERLDKLIKQRSVKMADSAFAQNKGKLPYPVVGRITESFGEHMVQEAGVRVMHNGIKITASSDGRVFAVFAGTVVYVDSIAGLGNLIIIQHDDTYYTVYSNVDEFYVKTMQKVAAGEHIGTIDPSVAGRPQLYFEIRQHGKAVNPAQWLKS